MTLFGFPMLERQLRGKYASTYMFNKQACAK